MKFDFDYYNFYETFAINPDFVISVKEIPETEKSVLIIDDFYKDVSKVRKIAMNCPYTSLREITSDAPLFRTFIPKIDYVTNVLSEIYFRIIGIRIKNVYDMFQFSLQTEEILNSTIRHSGAHTDTSLENDTFAGVMYLHGDTFGTSFYSNHYECKEGVLDNFTIRFPSVFHPKDYKQFEHLLTIPANLAGLPAISFPNGLANELPIGAQFVGKYFSEDYAEAVCKKYIALGLYSGATKVKVELDTKN